MKKGIVLLFCLSVASKAAVAQTAKPSFDCSKAKSASARLICSDQELSELDARLGSNFQTNRDRMGGADRAAFVKEQLDWIRNRNQKCGLVGKDSAPIEDLKGAKSCMAEALKSRIVELIPGNMGSAPLQNPKNVPQSHSTIVGEWEQFQGGKRSTLTFAPDGTLTLVEINGVQHKSTFKVISSKEIEWGADVVGAEVKGNMLEIAHTRSLDRFRRVGTNDIAAAQTGVFEPTAPQNAPNAAAIENILVNVQVHGCDINHHGFGGATATVKPGNDEVFFSNERMQQLLKFLWDKGHAACLQTIAQHQIPPNMTPGAEVEIRLSYPVWGPDEAGDVFTSSDGIRFADGSMNGGIVNSLRIRNGQRVAAQAEQQRLQQEAQRRADFKANLTSQFGVNSWIAPAQLSANPFVYQGRVVAVQTTFDHMLSASEAMFSGDLYVSGVPSTMFQGRVSGILVGRVTGNKGVKTPFGGEALVPALEYVGFHLCNQGECVGL